MALATQCPHCKTTFRVAQDQLKLRAGLVRCGSCKEIFNGIEHLLPSDSPAVPAPMPMSVPAPAALPVKETVIPATHSETALEHNEIKIDNESPATAADTHVATAPASAALDFVYPDIVQEEAAPVEFVEFIEVARMPPEKPDALASAVPHDEREHGQKDLEEVHEEDPLQRMTLVNLTDEHEAAEEHYIADVEPDQAAAPDEPDHLDQVIENLTSKPLRDKKKPKPYVRRSTPDMREASEEEPAEEGIALADEPDFVKQGRRKQTFGKTIRITMGVASFIFFMTALGQATYLLRDQLAVRMPETRPILVEACSYIKCSIGLPMHIDDLSIESDQLETLNTNKDASELSMLLRNIGTTSLAWPDLELTLNDSNNTTLARRVFTAQEYLPGTVDMKKGIASNSEQPIKLYFTFSGNKPAGYHVGVFYP